MIVLVVLFMFFMLPAGLAFALAWYASYVAHNQHFDLPRNHTLYDDDFGIDISEDYYREHKEMSTYLD